MAASRYLHAFQPNENVAHGFVRVLGHLADEARQLQQHPSAKLSESIHEGRILIKRLRALLWFAKPALAPETLAMALTRLRETSRTLATWRDREVLHSTLEKLARKSKDARAKATLSKALRTISGRKRKPAPSSLLRKAMTSLIETIEQIEQNTPTDTNWPEPSDRLARAFRATRKAARKALHDGSPEDFHEWRKRAKRLLYELELTQPKPNKGIARTIHHVLKLQAKLGTYHDCAVAETHLQKQSFSLPASLKKKKKRLRKSARKIALRIKSCR